MKLLFAVKSLELPGGGAERVLATVTAGLADRGHKVTLLSFDRPGGRPFYRLHPAVERVTIGLGDVRRGTTTAAAARRIAAMRRLARTLRPDVAIGFMHSAYIPLGLALAGLRIPLVASEHISYEHYGTRPLEARLLKLTPHLARAITAISPLIRDGFPPAIRRRMEVVPNPVSVATTQRADVTGGASKTLLAVGRLQEQKDHRTLIDAFGRIAGDFPEWRLRIVGEGHLRPDLERLVKTLGLEGRIDLCGARAEIEGEYLAAQLFVMPSRYESFGLTTAEALGHGLPVVGFVDCPGTNELVRHDENGLLVRGADRVAALAEGLRSTMLSPELRRRLAAAAPASILPFAPERVVDLWEDLLDRVRRPDFEPRRDG